MNLVNLGSHTRLWFFLEENPSFTLRKSYGRMIWSLLFKLNSSFPCLHWPVSANAGVSMVLQFSSLHSLPYRSLRYQICLDLSLFFEQADDFQVPVPTVRIGQVLLVQACCKLCHCSQNWLRKHMLLDSCYKYIRKKPLNTIVISRQA